MYGTCSYMGVRGSLRAEVGASWQVLDRLKKQAAVVNLRCQELDLRNVALAAEVRPLPSSLSLSLCGHPTPQPAEPPSAARR